jgi:GT2 family glycosyltransferase
VLPIYLIHWHARDWCLRSLATIATSTPAVSVTVIDNGGLGPCNVRVIKSGRNAGYSGGANLAIADWLAGDEPYAVVASHDLLVEPCTFAELVGAMAGHASLGIVGPHFEPWRFGGAPIRQSGSVLETSWVSGGCLLLRRACIEAIGPFDERYGSYVEDVDLSLRARDAGWRVGVVLDAPARSIGSGTSATSRQALIETNMILLRAKRREWDKALGRWLMQPLHACRHPQKSPVFVRAFLLAPAKLIRYWTLPWLRRRLAR